MQYPVTDDEKERGIVTLVVLPAHAEAIDDWLATRGFALSPPTRLSENEDPIRIITFADPPVSAVVMEVLDGQ